MNEQIYSKEVVDFVKVAADFCLKLEHSREASPHDLVVAMLSCLPYLYIMGTNLQNKVSDNGYSVDGQVTEADYNFIRQGIYDVLGQYDEYLDVFVEDMKYSDRPILRTVSEELSDIYQDLRNFLAAYRDGVEEMIQAALYDVLENFKDYWGQKCVNVMRALHDILYNQIPNEQ